jgi:hypothetical protein
VPPAQLATTSPPIVHVPGFAEPDIKPADVASNPPNDQVTPSRTNDGAAAVSLSPIEPLAKQFKN